MTHNSACISIVHQTEKTATGLQAAIRIKPRYSVAVSFRKCVFSVRHPRLQSQFTRHFPQNGNKKGCPLAAFFNCCIQQLCDQINFAAGFFNCSNRSFGSRVNRNCNRRGNRTASQQTNAVIALGNNTGRC